MLAPENAETPMKTMRTNRFLHEADVANTTPLYLCAWCGQVHPQAAHWPAAPEVASCVFGK